MKIDKKEKAVVVIGSGPGGAQVAYQLTKQGIPVVLLEAGRRIMKEEYVNEEWPAFSQMAWLDKRTMSGNARIVKDFNGLPTWLVKAVGGTATHWAGATPRFLDYEWKTKSTYGSVDGATLMDWPIDGKEMKPYYVKAEDAIGSTHRGGRPPLPANNNYKVFAEGAKRNGYKFYATGPYGTNAAPYDGRPASIQDGFNFQGDKNGSKWNPNVSEIPKALATGKLELRTNSQAVQITTDSSGKADGVLYMDTKTKALHRQEAKVICVAGNSIETPRLFLMSASSRFPNGLANSSDQVGRNYMRHLTGSVYATFDKPVNFFRGETMAGFLADEVKHNPKRGFVGGYYLETLALGPSFLGAFLDPGKWGKKFADMMDGYQNMAGMWIVGEDMPQANNRITLGSAKDAFGLPAPNVHFDDHPNDTAMRNHAYEKGEAIYKAVGATQTYRVTPYPHTHNLGSMRMSAKAKDGVVDKWGRCHDVKNLFVSDGSVMTTGAACNPTLTITALAIRQGEYLADQLKKGNI